MGKIRKNDGYNTGKFKEVEYFLKGLRAPIYKLINFNSKHKYQCPICNYNGPFLDKKNRHSAKCPKCGELERARMAMLVLNKYFDDNKAAATDVLHISPENFLRKLFKKKYKSYITGDLYRKDVDKQFNIENIPFADNSFDLVFASHVLEYVKNDTQAISEIKRVLRPGGLAMLPVPVIQDKTIDYDERPKDKRNIREIGIDYFDRYREVFSNVNVYESSQFEDKFKLTIDMKGDLDSESSSHKYQLPNLLPVCRT